MSDLADLAFRETEHALEVAKERRAKSALPPLPFTGFCHNCGEEVPPPTRFCALEDGEPEEDSCLRDYEHRMNRKSINRR